MSKRVRLRNASTLFNDPETGFSLSGDDVVEMPTRIGQLTRLWLQGGGLIIEESKTAPVEITEAKITEPEPVVEEVEDNDEDESVDGTVELEWKFYTREEVEQINYFDLIRLASAYGLKYAKKKPKGEQLRDDFMAHQEMLKANL